MSSVEFGMVRLRRTKELARDVASAVVWLDLAQVQQLMRLLLAERWAAAQVVLDQTVPDLPDECDLMDPLWQDAWLDELAFRVAPPDEDDPDDVATREVPDYARYARAV